MSEPLDLRPDERPLLAMFERYADAVADDRPFDVIAWTAQRAPSERAWPSAMKRPWFRVAAVVAILVTSAAVAITALPGDRDTSSVGAHPSPDQFPLQSEPGWLAYSTGVVRLVRTDGTDDHAVATTNIGEVRQNPEWTGDGAGIILEASTSDGGPRRLWRYDLESDASRPVVLCEGDCVDVAEAAPAPDGLGLAWFYADGPNDSVMVDGTAVDIPHVCGLRMTSSVDAKSDEVAHTLTSHTCGTVEDRFPRWSPDGKRLAYVRSEQAVRGGPATAITLVVRDLASGVEAVIGQPADLSVQPIDWTTDGSGLLWSSTDGSIRRTRLQDGSTDTFMVSDDASGMLLHPRATKDGRWVLAFQDVQEGASIVSRSAWAVPAAGGPSVQVLPEGAEGTDQHHTWVSLQP